VVEVLEVGEGRGKAIEAARELLSVTASTTSTTSITYSVRRPPLFDGVDRRGSLLC
jgi:hypothetical protein